MANKKLFTTHKVVVVPVATAVNSAGGKAYAFNDEHTLAQGIVTSCFGSTFYMSEQEQLGRILELAQKCKPEFVAKAAVYGHEVAKMKDSPALMLAVLAARAKNEPEAARFFSLIFPRIITRFKMLQNFVQIVRSGKTGRRSFGSLPKRLIRKWFASRTGNALFTGSIGSDPSFADVIKMVHPKPETYEKKNFYAYMIGRDYNVDSLPSKVREYEDFKKFLLGQGSEVIAVPNVPFQMLASLPLKTEHWRQIIMQMPWNALRMNLNTAARHGAFKDNKIVKHVVELLGNPDEVRRNNVFPYQLLTTFQNIDLRVPSEIKNALQDAMEIATENTPIFEGGVAVCIDTSGSMSSVVTGYRKGSTTVTRCVEIAALVGASIARRNPNAILLPFDTRVHATNELNPRDSIMTNAAKLSKYGGGGTDVASAMRFLNGLVGSRPKTVIFVSDNESWYNPAGFDSYRGTGLATEWATYKKKVKGAKLVCVDLVANATGQVLDSGDVINLGGFNDGYYRTIERFVKQGDTDFVKFINETISFDTFVADVADASTEEDVRL